ADLFTVFWTKSAMVGYSFACQGSREYDRQSYGMPRRDISLTLSGGAQRRSHRKSAAQWVTATEAFPITGYRLEMF
ncbi:MAG TPA: hypothetical protein PKH75_12630, partial [Bacillota bacterium]|nr:hypothetical protein [Bacillota bacterium]